MNDFFKKYEPTINAAIGSLTLIMGTIATCIFGNWAHLDNMANLTLQKNSEAKKHQVCIVPVEAKFKIHWDSMANTFKQRDGACMVFSNASEIAATEVALTWKFDREGEKELSYDERFTERVDPTPTSVQPNGLLKIESLPNRFKALYLPESSSIDELFGNDSESAVDRLFEVETSKIRGVLRIVGHSLHGGDCETFFDVFAHKTNTGICVHLSRIRDPGLSGAFGKDTINQH